MSQAIKIIPSDYIKAEVFQLPVIDLSIRFLIRITKPVETTIVNKQFRTTAALNLMPGGNAMEKAVLDFWRNDVFWNVHNMVNPKSEEELESLNKLRMIDKVKIINVVFDEWRDVRVG